MASKDINVDNPIDYQALGLKIGLELHQQLDTKTKLFCNCPTIIREESPDLELLRELRPTQSELGEVDRAALFEYQKHSKFIYEGYNDTVCLVEQDEEPPHYLDQEALEISLTMNQLLNSVSIDEIHVMRKIVIDGSNTGGFQRTCIVGLGGYVEDSQIGRVGIQAIGLEEDAARKIETDTNSGLIRYKLDRLGIPLIEIATAPEIFEPQIAPIVAEKIGLLLRSTRKVKRGQGTIRQDLNVSIRDGGLIEVKGVQRLDLIEKIIKFEVQRQLSLMNIQKHLSELGLDKSSFSNSIQDVTDIFKNSNSKVLQISLHRKGKILALKLPKMSGIIGQYLQPERRLGTELADYAKLYGQVRGLFHTDELPNYGIEGEDVKNLRKAVKAQKEDAIIIIAAQEDNARKGLLAVQERIKRIFDGIPAETRAANEDGSTSFTRPRPGSARMYPETDVAPTIISDALLKKINNNLPENLESKRDRFVEEYRLSKQVSSMLVGSLQLDLFEDIMEQVSLPASVVASTLLETWKSIKRDGIAIDELSSEAILDIFRGLSQNLFAKEAIPDVLIYLANHPNASVSEATSNLGIKHIDMEQVKQILGDIVKRNISLLQSRKEGAIGPLMGDAMKELQGKIDGKIINNLLREAINDFLKSQ